MWPPIPKERKIEEGTGKERGKKKSGKEEKGGEERKEELQDLRPH